MELRLFGQGSEKYRMPQNINYQHLYYFWNVVREDSFTKASRKLGLAQPTISGQIATFEKSLGTKLFVRQGRRINLTESGHVVYNYAEKIFCLGKKMREDIKSSSFIYYHTIILGYRNSIPSHIISKFSSYLFDKADEYRITCLTDNNEAILSGVARKSLDVAITDEPLGYMNGLPLYSHPLLESDISVLANGQYSELNGKKFPGILASHPCIMPSQNSRMRQLVDEYLLFHQIKPNMIAEVENYDTMLNMVKNTPYISFAPSIIVNDIQDNINLQVIHKMSKSIIKYYAVTINKKPDKEVVSHIINKSQFTDVYC